MSNDNVTYLSDFDTDSSEEENIGKTELNLDDLSDSQEESDIDNENTLINNVEEEQPLEMAPENDTQTFISAQDGKTLIGDIETDEEEEPVDDTQVFVSPDSGKTMIGDIETDQEEEPVDDTQVFVSPDNGKTMIGDLESDEDEENVDDTQVFVSPDSGKTMIGDLESDTEDTSNEQKTFLSSDTGVTMIGDKTDKTFLNLEKVSDKNVIINDNSKLEREINKIRQQLAIIMKLEKERLINSDKTVNNDYKYLELNSAFRDRKLYPFSSNFVINVSEFGTSQDATKIINPISDSYPIYNFQGPNPSLIGSLNDDTNGNDNTFKYGSFPQPTFGGDNNTKNINGAGNNSKPNLDGRPFVYNNDKLFSSTVSSYYDGLTLCRYRDQSGIVIENNTDVSGSLPNESSIVIDFKSFDKEKIINNDISGNFLTSPDNITQTQYTSGLNSNILKSEFNIRDPSGWNSDNYWTFNEGSMLNISNPNEIMIHGGSDIDDYYKGYYLEDCTLPLSNLQNPDGTNNELNDPSNRFKKILSYDGSTKMAIISSENQTGFIAEDTISKKAIIDDNFINININSDRANSFCWLSDISGTPVAVKQQGSADCSGSTGWIPQDRYRIRKDKPLVMGWGYNEDRNAARPRIGYNSDIRGDLTGGSNWNTTGYKNEINFREYSGTGPQKGMNGAASRISIVKPGKNFAISSSWVYTNVNYLENNDNSVNNLYIEVLTIDENGGIVDARVAWPSGGFSVGQEVLIYSDIDVANAATVRIEEIGQSIDISNGFLGKTTGVLSSNYNEYKGQLIYIPSRGPERKSSQTNTTYSLTGYMNTTIPESVNKNPEYISDLPCKYNNNNEYDQNTTGVSPIQAYITSTARFVRRKFTTDLVILESSNPFLWEYTTWNSIWSSGVKSQISHNQTNVSPCTFEITSSVGFNEPQICGFAVDLDEGTYNIKVGYDLVQGQCSLFCRRWSEYNNISSKGYNPDIINIGEHMFDNSVTTKTFQITIPNSNRNSQRNSSYYIVGVVFTNLRTSNINMTANVGDNVKLNNISITKNNSTISNNQYRFGNPSNWDTETNFWSNDNGFTTIQNGFISNALQLKPNTGGNASYFTLLNDPNTSVFTRSPDGNYGNGYDNQENGEFGYKFTVNQDVILINRLGRELWNMTLANNTTINLWSVTYLNENEQNIIPITSDIYASSIINNNMTTSDTSITVSGTYFSTRGTLTINKEQIRYTTKNGNILSGLVRGVNGTNATTHNSGDTITQNISSELTQELTTSETTAIRVWDSSTYTDKGIVKINNEYIKYTSVTGTSPNWTLNNLTRGQHGSVISNHPVNSVVIQTMRETNVDIPNDAGYTEIATNLSDIPVSSTKGWLKPRDSVTGVLGFPLSTSLQSIFLNTEAQYNSFDDFGIVKIGNETIRYYSKDTGTVAYAVSANPVITNIPYTIGYTAQIPLNIENTEFTTDIPIDSSANLASINSSVRIDNEEIFYESIGTYTHPTLPITIDVTGNAAPHFYLEGGVYKLYIGRSKNVDGSGGHIISYNNTGTASERNLVYNNYAPNNETVNYKSWGQDSLMNSSIAISQLSSKSTTYLEETITSGLKDVAFIGWGTDSSYNNISYDGKISSYFKDTDQTKWRIRENSEIANKNAFTYITPTVDDSSDTAWMKEIGYTGEQVIDSTVSNTIDTSYNITNTISNNNLLCTFIENDNGTFKGKCKIGIPSSQDEITWTETNDFFSQSYDIEEYCWQYDPSTSKIILFYIEKPHAGNTTVTGETTFLGTNMSSSPPTGSITQGQTFNSMYLQDISQLANVADKYYGWPTYKCYTVWVSDGTTEIPFSYENTGTDTYNGITYGFLGNCNQFMNANNTHNFYPPYATSPPHTYAPGATVRTKVFNQHVKYRVGTISGTSITWTTAANVVDTNNIPLEVRIGDKNLACCYDSSLNAVTLVTDSFFLRPNNLITDTQLPSGDAITSASRQRVHVGQINNSNVYTPVYSTLVRSHGQILQYRTMGRMARGSVKLDIKYDSVFDGYVFTNFFAWNFTTGNGLYGEDVHTYKDRELIGASTRLFKFEYDSQDNLIFPGKDETSTTNDSGMYEQDVYGYSYLYSYGYTTTTGFDANIPRNKYSTFTTLQKSGSRQYLAVFYNTPEEGHTNFRNTKSIQHVGHYSIRLQMAERWGVYYYRVLTNNLRTGNLISSNIIKNINPTCIIDGSTGNTYVAVEYNNNSIAVVTLRRSGSSLILNNEITISNNKSYNKSFGVIPGSGELLATCVLTYFHDTTFVPQNNNLKYINIVENTLNNDITSLVSYREEHNTQLKFPITIAGTRDVYVGDWTDGYKWNNRQKFMDIAPLDNSTYINANDTLNDIPFKTITIDDEEMIIQRSYKPTAVSTLLYDISGNQSDILVTDLSNFDSSGVIQIDNEYIYYFTKTGGSTDYGTYDTRRQKYPGTAISTLQVSINSTDTDIYIDGTEFATLYGTSPGRFYIKIENELIFSTTTISSISATEAYPNGRSRLNGSSSVKRGSYGTAAASHSAGSTVEIVPSIIYKNSNTQYWTRRGWFGSQITTHSAGSSVVQSNMTFFERGTNAVDDVGNKLLLSSELSPGDTTIYLKTDVSGNSNLTGTRLPNASESNPVLLYLNEDTIYNSMITGLGNEVISYTGKTANTLTGVKRHQLKTQLVREFPATGYYSTSTNTTNNPTHLRQDVSQVMVYVDDPYIFKNSYSGNPYCFVGAELIQLPIMRHAGIDILGDWTSCTDPSKNNLFAWSNHALISGGNGTNNNDFLKRNLNILQINNSGTYSNGDIILPVLVNGGEGAANVTITLHVQNSGYGLPGTTQDDLSGCFVQFNTVSNEYLELVSATSNTITVKREPASLLAASQSYTGQLSTITLAPGTGKRRGFPGTSYGPNTVSTSWSTQTLIVKFIMSGGSNGSGGSATTQYLKGTIIPWNDNGGDIDNIRNVTNLSGQTVNIGSDTFSTSDTKISFCIQKTFSSAWNNRIINTLTDHPKGSYVRGVPLGWTVNTPISSTFFNDTIAVNTPITTRMHHSKGAITTYKQSYIDVGSNSSPSFLNTGENVDIGYTEYPGTSGKNHQALLAPKVNLYVGNSSGTVKLYDFGTFNELHENIFTRYDRFATFQHHIPNTHTTDLSGNYQRQFSSFLNDWTFTGDIKDDQNNVIDVGSNSSPTFVDISGTGVKHMFVGNSDGNIIYYQNTGTNASPVWKNPGLTVKDTSGNNISVPSNAKPVFVNIRGLNPSRYDLFIGDGSGNIKFYINDGTGGPWSGATTWPFVLNNARFPNLANKTAPVGRYVYPKLVNTTRGYNSSARASHNANANVSQWGGYFLDTNPYILQKTKLVSALSQSSTDDIAIVSSENMEQNSFVIINNEHIGFTTFGSYRDPSSSDIINVNGNAAPVFYKKYNDDRYHLFIGRSKDASGQNNGAVIQYDNTGTIQDRYLVDRGFGPNTTNNQSTGWGKQMTLYSPVITMGQLPLHGSYLGNTIGKSLKDIAIIGWGDNSEYNNISYNGKLSGQYKEITGINSWSTDVIGTNPNITNLLRYKQDISSNLVGFLPMSDYSANEIGYSSNFLKLSTDVLNLYDFDLNTDTSRYLTIDDEEILYYPLTNEPHNQQLLTKTISTTDVIEVLANVSDYSPSGVIRIDNEQILYTAKTADASGNGTATLSQNVTSTSAVDIFVNDIDFITKYPKQELQYIIVQIDDEFIRFWDYNILYNYLSKNDMERGYMGTIPATHNANATVTLHSFFVKTGMQRGYNSTQATTHLLNTTVFGNYSPVDPNFRGVSTLTLDCGPSGEIFIDHPELFDSSGIVQVEDELILYNHITGNSNGVTTTTTNTLQANSAPSELWFTSGEPFYGLRKWSTVGDYYGDYQWTYNANPYSENIQNRAFQNAVHGIMKIDDEIIRFDQWVIRGKKSSGTTYISGASLVRGYHNTTPALHPAGSPVTVYNFIVGESSFYPGGGYRHTQSSTKRGYGGTTAASHTAGTQIKQFNNSVIHRGSNAVDITTNSQLYSSSIVDKNSSVINLRTWNASQNDITGTRLPVASQSNPITIRLENEYITYTEKTANTITGLTRHVNQTTLGQPFYCRKMYQNKGWEPITLPNAEARHKFRSGHQRQISASGWIPPLGETGYDYLWIGAEKVQYQSYITNLGEYYNYNGDLLVKTDVSDNQLGCITSYPGTHSTDRAYGWSTIRNMNRRRLWGYATNVEVLPQLIAGGDGTTTITLTFQEYQDSTRRYNEWPPDVTNCNVQLGYEYLQIVSYTTSSITVKRELPGTLAASQSYSGTLSQVVLATGTGKRRVIAGGGNNNYISVADNATLTIHFIMSGGSNGSGGNATTLFLQGDINADDNNVDTITNIKHRSNQSAVSLGSDTFNTSNTVISFCNQFLNTSENYINTAIDHPIGTKVLPMVEYGFEFGALSNKIYLPIITTNVFHSANSVVNGSKFSYIDVGNKSSPALLDTGSSMTLANTTTNKLDLYVGNGDGNIKYYEFGTINNSSSTFLNDWVDRGFIKDSANNIIDVGSNAGPTFVDISGNGVMHMFVGNSDGILKFYRNSGTNLSPIWQTGITVQDNLGNDIDVSGNAKPVFVNIRAMDPVRYDLFIGDGSGSIVYYENNGNVGPWDGSTTTWPFVKNSSIYDYLTDKVHQTSELVFPTLQGVTRGINDTSPASHAAQDVVSQRTKYKVDNTNNSGRGYDLTSVESHDLASTVTLISGSGTYFDTTNRSITLNDGTNIESVTYNSLNNSNLLTVSNRVNTYPDNTTITQQVVPIIDNSGNRDVTDVSGVIIASAVINSNSAMDLKTSSAWATTELNGNISASDTTINMLSSTSFWSGLRTYSALIGTYPSNYEIVTYQGVNGNQLTNVTRGQANTTAKIWPTGTAILQCSGWGWTKLDSSVQLSRNNSYYITLSSEKGVSDPWRFGSWNQIGSQWPTPPTYNSIPDYPNGSNNVNVNTSAFGTYDARVFSRERANGIGYQSIMSFPDENTDNTNDTGWPVVNVSYSIEESQKTSYNIDVTISNTENNTSFSKNITLNTYSAAFFTHSNILDKSQAYPDNPTMTTRHYNGYNKLTCYKDDVSSGTLAISDRMSMTRGWHSNSNTFKGDGMTVEFSPYFDYSKHEKSSHGYGIIGLSRNNSVFGMSGVDYGIGFGNYGGSETDGYTINFNEQYDLSNNIINRMSSVFDTNNNKLVITYNNSGNNRGYIRVGNVDNNSMLYGDQIEICSTELLNSELCVDYNSNKLVIFYTTSNTHYVKVGSLSGNSITIGTEVILNVSNVSKMYPIYDPVNNNIIVFYNSSNNLVYKIGTVTGNSITFTSETIVHSYTTDVLSVFYNTNGNQIVLAYADTNNSNYGTIKLGTVLNNNITFGNGVIFNYNYVQNLSICYINSGKFVIAYDDKDNNNIAGIIGEITDSTITLGNTSVLYESATWQNETFYKSLKCMYNTSSSRIIVSFINHSNNNMCINSGVIYNTNDIMWNKGVEHMILSTSVTFMAIEIDNNNKTICLYDVSNVSKYRIGSEYSEIFTGMKVYESGVLKYTFPNNGYYENGIRYSIKYDEPNTRIRYYRDDVEMYNTIITAGQYFYFKYVHSRLGSGATPTTSVPRTRDCIAGYNASLKSTTLDLKLSKYYIFKDDVYVATILPSTFYDITIDSTFAVSGVDSKFFYIVRNGLYLKQEPDYYVKNSYTITITETNLYGGTFQKSFTLNVADPVLGKNDLIDYQFHNDYISDASGTIIPIYSTSDTITSFNVNVSGTDASYFNILNNIESKSYDPSGNNTIGSFSYQSGIKVIASTTETSTTLRKGITGYFYGIPSQSYIISIDAETNNANVNGCYLYISEKSLQNNDETILISKLSDNPVNSISSTITSTRSENKYYFKASGTGLVKIALYFQGPWNQNDYCIIHSMNILQEDILGSWKLTNNAVTQPYIINNYSNDLIGEGCAENGLGVVIINNSFEPVIPGSKHDGSLSRYAINGTNNRLFTGQYDVKNSYNWEILSCNGDGVQNLLYNSNTSSNMVYIRLKSLIVPVTDLKSLLGGGNISKYPYLYVSLTNVSSSNKGNVNIISSNNPNTLNAVFKVAINNLSNIDDIKFATLDGDNEVQLINLNPSENLEFKVFFGNGEILKTSTVDNVPPLSPDENLQISALFEIKPTKK